MSTQFNNSSNADRSNAFNKSSSSSLNNYTQVSSSKQLSGQSRASIKPSSQSPKQKPPAASTKNAITSIRQWFDNLSLANNCYLRERP
jgi:hypothetical protein